ncbi:MAG: SIS domain-containing protein [Spirochaetota bacterium]
MNNRDVRYKEFALVNEMLETSRAVAKMDPGKIAGFKPKKNKIFFTGEGSSRIFPGKKNVYEAMKHGYSQMFASEGATQALEYALDDYTVFAASNSGKTKECVRLVKRLKSQGHNNIIGVVATPGSPIMQAADATYVLGCGPEKAVAATKSVIEQALFYDLLFRSANNAPLPDLVKLGGFITQAMEQPLPKEITEVIVKARVVYFAGRNNGVAEELALKTNEITRKKSDFLEGTYAVHGIEEVMNRDEAVVIINPFEEEEEKFTEVLTKGVGLPVFAIASRKTSFPTIVIPEYGDFTSYIELAAGWNLLVEIGVTLGINLDKAERARKVGNEFIG